MKEEAEIFEKLLRVALGSGIRGIMIYDFEPDTRGVLLGDVVGLNGKMILGQINKTLAHEIAHYYLHYDKGNTLEAKRHAEYEEQAERAGKMLLEALAC